MEASPKNGRIGCVGKIVFLGRQENEMEFAGQIWPALRESRARAVRSDNVTEHTHASKAAFIEGHMRARLIKSRENETETCLNTCH